MLPGYLLFLLKPLLVLFYVFIPNAALFTALILTPNTSSLS